MRKWFIFPGLLLATTLQAGQIYKWTDEEGNVHFSTQPPPQVMDRVDNTGLSSSSERVEVDIESEIAGTWRGRKDGQVLELRLLWNRASLSRVDPGQLAKGHGLNGPYALNGERLVITRYDNNREKIGERTFQVRMPDPETLELVDIYKGGVYKLRKKPEAQRDLVGDFEPAMPGLWTEVEPLDLNSMLLRFVFRDGTFNAYRVGRYHKLGDQPHRNDEIGTGWWRIEDDWLTLEFWEADGDLKRPLFTPQRWRITRLDGARLEITDEHGRVQRVFRKSRSQ